MVRLQQIKKKDQAKLGLFLVELLHYYSNNPRCLTDLRGALDALVRDDPSRSEPQLGGVTGVSKR